MTEHDTAIVKSLRQIIRAVDLHSRQLANCHGLTGPQLICMRLLRQSKVGTPGELAKEMTLAPATMSGILDRLESRGMVERHRRERDKRQVRVELTRFGVECVDSAGLSLQERFIERLSGLPINTRSDYAEVLSEIVGLLEAENVDASPLLASGVQAGQPGYLFNNMSTPLEKVAERSSS
jgi:DNA-binding MarR family transcriptional regulator